ncbi:MAG: sigma-54 dependent transcriptional regulator [Bdellovibrionota bacterium]
MYDQATDTGSAAQRYQGFPLDANGRAPGMRGIITADQAMEKIFRVVEKVAETNSTVLVLGESGTGKELIARAIHELSGCRGHFVPVNCGAIPDNLLESELFGHEKGAFTGAVMSKPGRFVLADGGTIFLDEIGEMSPHLQVKLLRVLQDKVVESVGGLKPRQVNVRVIAATNVNLADQVREGKFREDLFYRLQVVPITLPALRERPGDIPALVNHFSRKFAERNDRRPLVFSDEVMQAFMRYSWPGNVRELENFIERLSILVDSNAIYLSDLPAHVLQGGAQSVATGLSLALPEAGLDFNQVVEQFENTLILQALERTQGNKKAAARLLNLNRTTLVEKIKKKGLELEDSSMEQ